jgi:hypothetical protein
MPIKNCQLNGKPGYKWGSEGKCYQYEPNNEGSKKNAKKNAIAQGLAIGDVNKMDVNKEQFAETYNDYPKAATENAKKALGWIEKYGRNNVDAGTLVGLARANQLAKGENISRDTIARMASFNRHRKNAQISPQFKGTPWLDRGYVAWLLWGGTEGVDWAIRKLEQIDNQKFHKENIIDFIDSKNLGISIEDLGITEEQLNNKEFQHSVDLNEFDKGDKVNFETMEFASLIKLYRYTSNDYGSSDIGPNSRSFCVQLVNRTKLSLMRFEDIVALNSAQPGMGKGGSDSYSVFNYRGGSNCRHIWVKYLFDPKTMNLVKAPVADQPKNGPIE